MPGLEEVQAYLQGLWLLVRGDRAGLAYLDLSERGSLRSFWAIVWCLPPIVLSWVWTRLSYLAAMPSGTHAGSLYIVKLALAELVGWIVPILLTGVVAAVAGAGARFNPLVFVINWLSVPFAYGNGFLLVLMLLLPGLSGFVALVWLMLLAAVIFAMERSFRMIVGPNLTLIALLVLVQVVPGLFLSEWLDRFLGVAIP